jgi:hypothetical protein
MSDATNPTPEDEQQAEESTQDAAAEQSSEPEAPASSGSSLGDQLDAAQAELAKRGAAVRMSTNVTVGIGVVLIVLMIGYFSYGLSQIKDLADPEILISLVQDQLQGANLPSDLDSAFKKLKDEGLPTSLEDLKGWIDEQIDANAGPIAEQFSKQAIEMAPSIRKTLENYALERMEELVDQGTTFTADKFAEMVDENRITIEGAMADIAGDVDLTEVVIKNLVTMLEEDLGTDIQEHASLVLGTLNALNTKLDRLATADDLNHEEQLEKDSLMLLRQVLVDYEGNNIAD